MDYRNIVVGGWMEKQMTRILLYPNVDDAGVIPTLENNFSV